MNLEELETTFSDQNDIFYGNLGKPKLEPIQWEAWGGSAAYLSDPFVEVDYPTDSEPIVRVEGHEFVNGTIKPFFRHKLAYRVKFDHLPDVVAYNAPFEAIIMPACT